MNRHKVGQILPTLQVASSGAHKKENEREREREEQFVEWKKRVDIKVDDERTAVPAALGAPACRSGVLRERDYIGPTRRCIKRWRMPENEAHHLIGKR